MNSYPSRRNGSLSPLSRGSLQPTHGGALRTVRLSTQLLRPSPQAEDGDMVGSTAVLPLLPIVMLRGIHQMLAAPDTRTQRDEDRCGPLFRRRHGYMNTAGRPPWLDSISSCVLRSLCHSRNRHTCCPQDPCVRAAAPHHRRDGRGCQAGLPAARVRSCGRHTFTGIIVTPSRCRGHTVG